MQSCRFIITVSTVMSLLLEHRLESESISIIHDTIEFTMYSRYIIRIRVLLEFELTEDNNMDELLIKAILRFCWSLFIKIDPEYKIILPRA
jgi:hypothetical protein